MGKYADVMDTYLADKDRFAELFNFAVFDGEPVVSGDVLEDDDGHYAKTESVFEKNGNRCHRFRDIKKRTRSGEKLILTAIENQELIDYTMPFRLMEYDQLEYGKQLRMLQNEKVQKLLAQGKKPTKWLTRMKKDEKIHPVYSLCFYHGTESWDGPRSLKDMMDFEGVNPAWEQMFHDYGMTLLCVEDIEDFSRFKTGLRQLLQVLSKRKDKTALKELLRQEDYAALDRDTAEAIAIFTDNTDVLEHLGEYEKDGGYDMCQAMDEWREELLSEGRSAGRAENLLGNIRSLMQTMKWTMEQAMDALLVPEEERDIYRAKM